MSKVPSSLAWLVRRRARLQGLIEAIEKEQARLAKMRDRVPEMKLDLYALDRILGLHEIPIDPSTIPTVRMYANGTIRMRRWFSHGELSRSLVALLAASESGRMTTRALSQALLLKVFQRFPNDGIDIREERKFQELVRSRLKSLCRIGRIERVKSPAEVLATGNEQEWKLPAR